jgi:biopolymer transport protein ExbB/TolQ
MDQALKSSGNHVLSWHKQDPESRLGLRGGRYTEINTLFSAALGLAATVAFFALTWMLGKIPGGAFLSSLFWERGPIPLPIVFLFFWAVAILLLKSAKLSLQRKPLTLAVLPQDAGYVLTAQTASAALERVETLADSPAQFILLNRLKLALSNLQNLGLVSEMVAMLESQAEADEQQVATSYQLVQGFIWAIPVFGFIGTVLGLSQAIQGFGGTLAHSSDFQGVQDALTLVVSGLATAFDTTLIALLAAVALQLASTVLRRREARFLDDCKDYCQRYVIGRLRLK